MVRSGTLPLRLLSLHYGADLVYGEEIVDKRIIATTRVNNQLLDTIDYVSNNGGGSVVFRTCNEEKAKVVFQIGTADPILALKAAERVAADVAAIDINMGCPKNFSLQGGMGAALLKKPEVACDILKTLRRNLNIPVSCKIRILEDASATIDLAKRLEQAGAVAVGLHCRQVHERPVDDAHWEALGPVVSSLSVPVLANGDIFVREDIEKVRKISGANSFLIARGALQNASIFRKQGTLPYTDVVVDYLKVAAETDNVFQNTKYNISRMIPTKCDANVSGSTVTVADLGATKNNLQMFALWDVQNYYEQTQDRFRAKAAALNLSRDDVDNSFQQPAHKYDDAFVTNQQFYCNTCKVQLLSDKDVELHKKGKKHKKKLRSLSSSTVSEQIAQRVVHETNASEVETTSVEGASREGDVEQDSADRVAKRLKREDNEAGKSLCDDDASPSAATDEPSQTNSVVRSDS
ncbi:Trna-dihydrouridine synthase, partial [Globisporangium splendens]